MNAKVMNSYFVQGLLLCVVVYKQPSTAKNTYRLNASKTYMQSSRTAEISHNFAAAKSMYADCNVSPV